MRMTLIVLAIFLAGVIALRINMEPAQLMDERIMTLEDEIAAERAADLAAARLSDAWLEPPAAGA